MSRWFESAQHHQNKPTQLSGFYYLYGMSIKEYINSLSSEKKDTEDLDNVLRVVSSKLLEKDVIQLMQSKGFVCEVLPD